jgi:hypothetical protein
MKLKDFLAIANKTECVFTIQDDNKDNRYVLQTEMPADFIMSEYLDKEIVSIFAFDREFEITIKL